MVCIFSGTHCTMVLNQRKISRSLSTNVGVSSVQHTVQWSLVTLLYPPHNEVVGGYIGFTPSVRLSVRPAARGGLCAVTRTYKLPLCRELPCAVKGTRETWNQRKNLSSPHKSIPYPWHGQWTKRPCCNASRLLPPSVVWLQYIFILNI